jgi:hypothetical protein
MKCNDISNHLVDFLYEEMPATERKEFQAHVDGCTSCSADVKAMAATLGHARQALRGPLAEEPPTRVHDMVINAAHAAARRLDTATTQSWIAPRLEPEGFFSRLWKTPWLMPAMGAAGVATVVLLVRVMKNPPVFPPQESAAPVMVQQPAPEPAATRPQPETEGKPTGAPAVVPLGRDNDVGKMGKKSLSEDRRAGEMPSRKGRAKAPADGFASSRRRIENDPLAGTVESKGSASGAGAGSSRRWAEPPMEQPAAKQKTDKSLDDLLDSPERFAQPSKSVELAKKPEPERLAPAMRAPAPASPPITAAAPVAAVKPRSAAKAKSAPDQEYQAEESARMESAPVASEKRSAAAHAASANRPVKDEDTTDKKESRESKEAAALQERIRKAEKLYAEKKWAEAAAAFRALIDQLPSHPSIKTWRNRLATAEAEQSQKLPVKAKAKVSNDALDGL